MAQQRKATPDVLESIVKNGKDNVVLSELKTYVFDGDLSQRKIPVKVSYTLANGKMTASPKTLGELREGFTGNLSYENRMGDADRSHIILRYADPKNGERRDLASTDRLGLRRGLAPQH